MCRCLTQRSLEEEELWLGKLSFVRPRTQSTESGRHLAFRSSCQACCRELRTWPVSSRPGQTSSSRDRLGRGGRGATDHQTSGCRRRCMTSQRGGPPARCRRGVDAQQRQQQRQQQTQGTCVSNRARSKASYCGLRAAPKHGGEAHGDSPPCLASVFRSPSGRYVGSCAGPRPRQGAHSRA